MRTPQFLTSVANIAKAIDGLFSIDDGCDVYPNFVCQALRTSYRAIVPPSLKHLNLSEQELSVLCLALARRTLCGQAFRLAGQFWGDSLEEAVQVEAALKLSIQDGLLNSYFDVGRTEIRLHPKKELELLRLIDQEDL